MRNFHRMVAIAALTGTMAWALPNYKEICHYMPDLTGWQAQPCTGMAMNNPMMGGEVVSAVREYTHDDASLTASVTTGMEATMMSAAFASGMSVENDDMLMKIEKIDDFNVAINYDKKERTGSIVVQLSDSAALSFIFENMDWKDALSEAKKFDWKKMRSLFQ